MIDENKDSSNIEKKLSVGSKIAYGFGKVGLRLQMGSVSQIVMPVFNDILGLDPRIIGIITSISKVFDSALDPFVGHLSDKTSSKYGRRRPWIFFASFMCAVSFLLLWSFPRGMGDGFYTIWLTLGLLFFYFSTTLFTVPYFALGMELTSDYHERTSVLAYEAVMGSIGGLLIANVYIFISWNIFSDLAHGMRYLSVCIAIIVLFCYLAPALFTKEATALRNSVQNEKSNHLSFFSSAKQTLRNRPFFIIVITNLCFSIGLASVSHLHYYMVVYHVFDGEKNMSVGLMLTLAGYATSVTSIVAIPFMTSFSKKLGKAQTLKLAFFIGFLGSMSKWIFYTPDYPFLLIIPGIMMTFATAMIWPLFKACIPDIIDLDEMESSYRREGMFSAMYSFITKAGTAVSLFIMGFILAGTGFDASLVKNQTPEVIRNIRVLYTFIPCVAFLLSYLAINHYKLTEDQINSIRTTLNLRHNR